MGTDVTANSTCDATALAASPFLPTSTPSRRPRPRLRLALARTARTPAHALDRAVIINHIYPNC